MGQSPTAKIPVLIASSLKPLRDTRAWEKLGLSLRETNKYALNIIGFSSKFIQKNQSTEDVRWFSSLRNTQSTRQRLLSQFRFMRAIWISKPKILICCTYEYLPIASIFKPIFGYKLVYDVQENYIKNLDLNPNLSGSKKKRAKEFIQLSEGMKGIDYYFLAEKCYQKEMPEKQPFLLLENKSAQEIRPKSALNFQGKSGFRFLISGTLSPAFGTLEGIQFFLEILKFFPESSLKIIGHTPLKKYRESIQNLIKNKPQISINASENPIPQALILEEFEQADFCLLPYQNHEAIRDKMPTKLFDAMALGVPILISKNPLWEEFLASYRGGISLDFQKPDEAAVEFQSAIQAPFFTSLPGAEVLWDSQKSELLSFLSQLD